MKKYILIIFLSGLISHGQKNGKLEFNSKVVDFGELKEGSEAKRSISFKNSGNKPVKIKKINSTGHVKVENNPVGEISENSNAKIVISYNTKKVGPIRRTLTVYSDAVNPIVSIKIKGIVKKN